MCELSKGLCGRDSLLNKLHLLLLSQMISVSNADSALCCSAVSAKYCDAFALHLFSFLCVE